MKVLHTLAALTCTLLAATTAHAERVKDLASVAGVRSESEGEEPNRRVVVLPDR